MVSDETGRTSWLDQAAASFFHLNVEKVAWILLLVAALLIRTVGLGDRAMTHDESLHTVYSFQLYDGRGYQHQPMMHGPLKFVLGPVLYSLFGVNDWSSRLIVALFGVAMVGFVWLLRPWLGRWGAFLTALMYTISPALVYHSRYIRDEVMLTALLVLLAAAMFRYLQSRSTAWLVITAVTLGLAFLTMEASFIFGGVFGIFLLLSLVAQLWSMEWPRRGDRRRLYRIAIGLGLPLLAGGLLLVVFKQKVPGIITLGAGGLLILAGAALAAFDWRQGLREFAELDLIVLFATLVLPFLSAVVLKAVGWEISQFNNPGQVTLELVWQGFLVLGILAIVSVVIGWYWLRKRWFLAAGAFWALEILFFTTFLTNGQGIGTGVIGSLGYWIDQQEVMRGGQPWYYFYGLVPLYEFLPLILSLAGTIWWLFRRRPERIPGEQIPLQSRFEAFLVFWPLATWAVFTWVGEKMPWHTVYFVTAMAPLAGLWLGRIIGRIDWVEARAKGVFWLMLMTPLLLIVLKALIPPSDRRPFDNVSVNGLSNTAQWVLALIVGLVLVYLIYDRILALGWKTAGGAMVISLSAVLMVLTIGVSYRFSFVNPDMATEPMVYAHGTPDIKLAMDQLEEVSRKTAGGHAVRVAYDDDATWPLEWYLRDYPNKVYYGASPSRDSLDAPVVIVGDKNVGKVKPYLGDRYHEFNYRLIWWPRETYKGLTWERIRGALQDPAQRKQIWDVILHRRYTTPTAQWDPIHRFTFFVRKDVASQVWDWGAPAVAAAGEAAAEDPYAGKERTVAAVQQIGFPGVSGSQPGQFNLPRAVTVDAEGRIYVADSGNHRVQVFAPDGVFLRQWGSLCKTDTQEGCEGAGDGQFNEPWGIAVDAAANVYVSDTWNHRIQHFGPDGQFLRAWGSFASTGGELAEETGFYGPRSVVIGRDGNVYVMDTGNKRVQVFTPDGNQITQWGGGGVVDGTFDEPVGLAQDGDGDWFVADTWNKRIQRFDEAYQYQAQWPISGWASQSVVNKPGLAVDGQRQLVYAADPEGYRILVFGTDGSYKGSFGQYGIDESSMTLPTGVAVGPDGKVYVADGDAHRIMVFPPWE